ncbi:HYR domain-containing protein [Flavobacterium hungaricum]|nr:HYR domain-containing protein [Flavobacterium hungaricum]
MTNFTLKVTKFFSQIFLILFLLFSSVSASAQFYSRHYIAPAPWQYFNDANEIVIATNSVSSVTISVSKSDGTLVTNLTAVKGTPAVYRFAGTPSTTKAYALNTVLNGAGLIVNASAPISINLRNVASDALSGTDVDKDIKGNAALTSFGDAGLGVRFRVGYYRDGSLGNFGSYGDQRPIYTILATADNTTIKINNVVTTTLNTGQSYLFKAPIGSLVESSNPIVMNTSAAIDTPGGCGDSAYNQIPPEAVLGTEYFLERGTGNSTAEQTTVVATKDNTAVTVKSYSTSGAEMTSNTVTLAKAGDFYTFVNGYNNTNFTASRIVADKRVAVYSGTAQGCEVDISTIAPVSECGGSNFIETAKFKSYNSGTLDYFGYILLRSATETVTVNGNNIANISGVSARYQIGSTGWYIINFNSVQIGSPNFLSIASNAKLTVSIVQQSGGFSMAGFFSNFAAQPEDPTLTYISAGGCTNSSATLTTPSGFLPYQWYYNGTAITGANSSTYTATKTGAYSVSSTLACGSQTQSKPVNVTLCTDLGITKTVNIASPCVNSNVEFTITASNLGGNNATGVSVNDLLPSGYTYVSSTASTGTYNSTTGVWSIGDLEPAAAVTLKVVATVKATGSYNNTAAFSSSFVDSNAANNSASVSTTPKTLPAALSLSGSTICPPASGGTITSTTSVSGVSYQLYNSSNAVVQTAKSGNGSGLTWSNVPAGTGYYVVATNSGPCSITSNIVSVVTDTQKPTITCPSNISKTTDANSCTATGVVLGTPVTADNCGVASVTNNAPSSYPIGVTTVTWTVTDNSGNTATCTQTVTITDTQKPTITCPSNISKTTDANSCIATGVVLGTPVTADNCGVASVTNNAPSTYPIGVTTVTWTVTDNSGNTQTCTQTVTITDTQKPTITCPSNISKTTDANSCTATGVVLGTPVTADNCGVASVNNNAPSSYPIGVTTVTWTVTDNSGNTQTCTQTVTITDTQKPTITCPSNVSKTTDANSCTATGVVLGTPITADNCGVASVTNNAPSTYPIGVTTVTWTVTDNSGNTQTCTQTVTITDTQKPTISCPSNITKTTDANSCTATGVVLGTPVTADNCGVASVTNNAPSSYPIGVTTVTWTVTDNSGNTATCTQTVTIVGPIKAENDSVSSFNGIEGGIAIVSVLDNDFLNCSKVSNNDINLSLSTTLPSALNFNTTTGAVSVNPGTPTGTYTFNYSICEKANTANCSTAVVTIEVVNDLIANADNSFGTKTSGASEVNVGNVTNNDTLNGVIVTTSNTDVTPIIKGPLSIDADGKLTLAANTSSGTYTITYEICETGANPSNCKTATATVEVKNIIKANVDTITAINGNIGGTTISLTANDTLNGNPFTVGNGAGQVTFTLISTLPAGLTLNADRTITVAPNTPAGNYDVEYRICDNNNSGNCDTVISTVPVTAGILVANADPVPSVTGSNASQTLGTNVFTNDTKNGTALNPSDVNLTVTTADPKGYLSLDPNGNVVLGANAPAGTYELTYTICEKLNPSNCSSNTVTVTVTAPVIDAVVDTITAINGNIGGTTISLTANDTLNGNPFTVGNGAGQVTFTLISTLPAGLTLNADRTITVAPNTPAGNYDVEYRICDNNNLSNCDTVTSTVPVTAGILVANADPVPSITGSNASQTLGTNVFTNDTKNGTALNPSDVNLTVTTADPKGFLSLDSNGNVVLGANAPAGTYELTYTICEKLNPSNCSSNTVTVTVTAPVIDAVVDTITAINGNIGGTTISLTANDTLNGNPFTVGNGAGQVTFTLISTLPAGLTLNADRTITVAPNTPAGNYDVEYRICENNNSGNCDMVISVVVVNAGTLVANEDVVTTAVGINTPQTFINIFTNDTKNGQPLVPSDVNLTVTTADPKGYLSLDSNGNVVLGANAPAGTYELTYTICEKLNSSNCSSNNVKVTVTEPKMTVTAASYCANNLPYVNYSVTPDNFTTANLLTINWIDSANNVVATQTNLPLSGTILWPGAAVDGNGNGTDWPGWVLNNGQWTEGDDGFELTRPAVTMQFVLNPTVNVSVSYPDSQTGCNARPPFSIKANDDYAGPLDAKKNVNAMLNIFTNDILNGIKPSLTDIVLMTVVSNPNLTLNADGSISVLPNTANGEYKLTYQICEALNTSNCSQAVVTVLVVNSADPVATPQLTLTNDTNNSVDGINGSIEFVNVLENDLLNGQPINPADVTVSPVTINPNFEWNADGTVNVRPNTAGGNYALTYQVCEKGSTTNCATAVLNVFVEVPAIAVIKTAVFNDENQSGYANAGETITYQFTVTNTGNVPLTNITITDPLTGVVVSGQPISLAVNESNTTNFSALYKITQEDINRGNVSNQASVKGQSQRGVVVEDQSDDSSNNGDNPTVLDLNGCIIKVFNAFSPNGDAKNARFYIQGLECYPNNTVEIYNRWGVLVFSIDKYNNQDRVFVGYSDGRSTVKQSEGLPVGTYFYILKYKDSDSKPHEKSGYLYINK